MNSKIANVDELLKRELELSVQWLWGPASNTNPKSPGYGLVLDRSNDKNLSSVASVGVALSAFIIGIERKILDREEVRKRVIGTLETFLYRVEHLNGFFSHFVSMETGRRNAKSEYSSIDTAIFLQGVIVAEAYFNDPKISALADLLIMRVDWRWLSFKSAIGSSYFHMAYNPTKGGDYVQDRPGFIWHWSMPAEQLMMYFQAAATVMIDETLARDLYFGFQRTTLNYEGISYIAPPGGALFLHQLSHAFIDFKNWVDAYGFNWYENAVNATKVAIKYAENNPMKFKGLNKHAWGFSASDGPMGYEVGGQPPFQGGELTGKNANLKGTIQPYSMLGSLPYKPEAVKEAIWWTYQNHPKLWGEWGFLEGYNLEVTPTWYAHTYLGIDKGISTLMIENFFSGKIWSVYMSSKYTQRALQKLGFRPVEEKQSKKEK